MVFASISAIWALSIVAAQTWKDSRVSHRTHVAAVRLRFWERATGPGNIGTSDRIKLMQLAYELRSSEIALRHASVFCGPALLLAYIAFR